MRPFPAHYIENCAFYVSFGLGRLLRPPEAPKKSNFQLHPREKFIKQKSCIFAFKPGASYSELH